MFIVLVVHFLVVKCAHIIFFCYIWLQSVVCIRTHMLTPPHASPVVRGSAAQMVDGYKSYYCGLTVFHHVLFPFLGL